MRYPLLQKMIEQGGNCKNRTVPGKTGDRHESGANDGQKE